MNGIWVSKGQTTKTRIVERRRVNGMKPIVAVTEIVIEAETGIDETADEHQKDVHEVIQQVTHFFHKFFFLIFFEKLTENVFYRSWTEEKGQ